MSLDINAFLASVKQAALEAVDAGKPFSLAYGTVTSAAPLVITVDQKMQLTTAQLLLTNSVRDYTVYMTVDHTTEDEQKEIDLTHKHRYAGGITEDSGKYDLMHKHIYKGTKVFRVHLGLQVGENVLLLRADGGQKFIVLDRVGAPT